MDNTSSSDPSTIGTSGYDRIEHDFYETPEWCTQVLLDNIRLYNNEVIWEPACGRGAITEVLARAGHTVISSDLIDRNYGTVSDFLTADGTPHNGVTHIITNPPYGEAAEDFLVKALDLMMPINGAVSMLLRNEYDCAKKRKYLFNESSYFAKKIVMTKRPRWITGTTVSPRFNYAWYHFNAHGDDARIVYV